MMRTIGLLAAVPFWGLLVFMVGLRFNFPEDAALSRIQWEVQDATDGEMAFDAVSASPWRLSGMSFEDAVLYKVEEPNKRRPRRRAAQDETPVETPAAKVTALIKADSASARVALLPLLRGSRMVEFAVEAFGGELTGSAGTSGEVQHLSLDGEDLDLSHMPLEGEEWKVGARGIATLVADIHFDTGEFKESSGHGSLKIADFAIDELNVYGMDLPAATFTDAELEFDIKRSEVELTSGHFASNLFDATLSGGATISNKNPGRWRLHVEVKATLDENLDRMLKGLPKMRDARDNDGVYHFLCSGSIGTPRCREDRVGSGHVGATGPRTAKRPAEDVEEDDSNLPPDERREQRLERIKERRDRLRQEREDARGTAGDLETEGAETSRHGRVGGPIPRPDLGEPEMMDDEPIFDDDLPMDRFDDEPLPDPLDEDPAGQLPGEQFEE